MKYKYPFKERLFSFLINFFTLGFYGSVQRATHKKMNENSISKYRYGGNIYFVYFETFKIYFLKIKNWQGDYNYPGSLFTPDYFAEYHASIIRFGKKNFTLSTYGFLKSKLFVKKYIKNNIKLQILTEADL